jgi:GAF domain-containing protein
MAENQDGIDLTASPTALTGRRGLDAFLQELTERAVRSVGGADSCSVTMHRNGRFVTAAGSDDEARKLDSLQYEADAGPCVCSVRRGREQYAPDLAAERRWFPYPEQAATFGIGSVLAAPIQVNSTTLGALNLYAHEPRAFEPPARGSAIGKLADQAAGAVAVAARFEEERTALDDLRAAMLSRAVIDQAIGIVMARSACPEHEALATLRRASQHRNIKLRDLCRELVLHTGGSPHAPGGFSPRR